MGLPFFLCLSKRLLRLMHIVESDLSGFDQMRHDRLNTSAEESKQLINQPALNGIARHAGLEDMRVADLLHTTHRLLHFHAIDGRLNRGVGGTALWGKRFLYFANGSRTEIPQRLHDLQFKFSQPRQSHIDQYSYSCVSFYYTCLLSANSFR